jgi:arsenate reductase-like glutaredoxin family protein
MDKIEIYTNNNCGYCKAVKDEFEKQNIEFENKNTEDYKRRMARHSWSNWNANCTHN